MLTSSHFWKIYLPPHLIAIIGIYLLQSWTILWIAMAFYVLISGLGVAVGFHRYFSHRAFNTTPGWEQAMLFFGCLACQGNPLFWVALHRGLHHKHADTEKDPHSPIHGLWEAYQGYAFTIDPKSVPIRAGADFLRHPEWKWSLDHYHKIVWGTWISLAILSPVILVGLACAQVWAVHQEALVNLLGHTGGFGAYRNFETEDKSVNRPLLGLLTWGQSIHNNHHKYPANPDFAAPRHMRASGRFEFDPSMLWVRLIGKLKP